MNEKKQAILTKLRPPLTPEFYQEHKQVSPDGVEYLLTRLIYPTDDALEDVLSDLMDKLLEIGPHDDVAHLPGPWIPFHRCLVKAAKANDLEPFYLSVMFENYMKPVLFDCVTNVEFNDKGQWRGKHWSGMPTKELNDVEESDSFELDY